MQPEVPEGLRAFYWHYRTLSGADGKPAGVGTKRQAESAGLRVLPYGGETVCRLYSVEGELEEKEYIEVSYGQATCRPDEQYNRKLGRNIALGRAVKSLEDKGVRKDLAEAITDRGQA